MASRPSLLAFLLSPLLAVGFVLLSAAPLPHVVAAHFAAGGAANGFMPRQDYVTLMAGLVAGLPLLVALMSSTVRLMPARYVNLPNRDYWLAPERRAETLAFVQRYGMSFALVLDAFLCFVHWLVVRANAQIPPLFPERLFMQGAFVFLAAVAVWIATFVTRFRRRQR